MNSERLQSLLGFLEEDPENAFTLYAIALEYLSNEDEKAEKYLQILLNDHPNYLPTYYHAGQYFYQHNHTEKAKSIYEKGITLGKKQKNSLAIRELQNALNTLLFEEED